MAGTKRQNQTRKAERRIAESQLARDRALHPIPTRLSNAGHIGNAIRAMLKPELLYNDPNAARQLQEAKVVLDAFDSKFKAVNALLRDIKATEVIEKSDMKSTTTLPTTNPSAIKDPLINTTLENSNQTISTITSSPHTKADRVHPVSPAPKKSKKQQKARKVQQEQKPALKVQTSPAPTQKPALKVQTSPAPTTKPPRTSCAQVARPKTYAQAAKLSYFAQWKRNADRAFPSSKSGRLVPQHAPTIEPARKTLSHQDFSTDILARIVTHAVTFPYVIPVDSYFRVSDVATVNHIDPRHTAPGIIHCSRAFYSAGIPAYYSRNTFAIDLQHFLITPATHSKWPRGFGIDLATKFVRKVIISTTSSEWEVAVGVLRGFDELEEITFNLLSSPDRTAFDNSYAHNATAELADVLRAGGVKLIGGGDEPSDADLPRVLPGDSGVGKQKKQGKITIRHWFKEKAEEDLNDWFGKKIRDGAAGSRMMLRVPRPLHGYFCPVMDVFIYYEDEA